MLNLFVRLHATLAELRNREEGQTMAEYGVVLAVITPALVLALALLAGSVENLLRGILRVLGAA